MTVALPDYIVAIGSSAGGLEALTSFLNHLPSIQSLAVIIAQHLSPTYKSHLVELLARETSWPVLEIKSGMSLQAERVYIIPPDAEATLNSGHFELHPPASAIGPKPSASLLFASVSKQEGTCMIAIVLSGTGSDGSQGLAAVKASGGWCFAHTPEDARYNGMPLAAIQSGHVDYVLNPSEMGAKIEALIKEPRPVPVKKTEIEDSVSDAYGQIINLLTEQTGTDFSNYKPSTINRRLQKRLDHLEKSSYEQYLKWLRTHPSEVDSLFKSLLIGVTRFFRDSEVFQSLELHLLSLLQHKNHGESLRIWVAGCASGEEVYTIAMIVQDLLHKEGLQLQVQIFATDISDSSIITARQAIYSEESLGRLPDEMRQKYFQISRNGYYQVNKSIRSMVLFSRHDLTVNPPFLRLDLISCRNLLIYFDASLQKRIIPLFHFALNPEGLLLLGKSETIGQFSELFSTVNSGFKLFRRRNHLSSRNELPLASFKPINVSSLSAARSPVSIKEELSLKELVKKTVFECFPSAYVVVNESLDLLHIHGDVSAYLSLSPGRISTNLLKLCHKSLRVEIRSLSSKGIRDGYAMVGTFRRWPDAESKQLLRIVLQPVLSECSLDGLFMIIFETLDLESQFIPAMPVGSSAHEKGRIRELEAELTVTREYLQSFVEELEATNEELQALNEEFQSTNEELQSANEELETANEELQSTNEEMQVAYAELRSANEVLERKDLILQQSRMHTEAILENNAQGFMLIDRHYHLVAFNGEAERQHHLHFSIHLQQGIPMLEAFEGDIIKELLPLMQKTLQEQIKTQHDFYFETAGNEFWYRYTLLPVLKGHQLTGITLSMQDITAEVTAHHELEKSNALIDSVFDATSTGISVTDSNGVFIKVNQGYCDIYGYTAHEMLGQHFTLVVLPEQKKIASKMYDDFIHGKEELPCEWKMQRKDGSFIDVFISSRLLMNPDGSRYKVATVGDISESKKNRDLLSDTQQAMGIGGWEVDVVNNTVHWTPEVYAIYGLPMDAAIDLDSAFSYYPVEARHEIQKAVQEAIEAGTVFDMELPFNRSDEQSIWVRVTCKPIRVYNKTVKLLGTFQDITERKLAEEDKSRLIHELTHKNEDLKQFTYIISHNLRSHVANLLGLANLLELTGVEETDILKQIKGSATQLDTVIQDLNQILSVRRQDQLTCYQQVNLKEEVDELLSTLDSELKALGAQVTLSLEQTQIFTIRSYMQSILYNLLSNAIKYASDQRDLQISIRSWQENEILYLSVKDNGKGIDTEKFQTQMFRLYKRFHPQIPGKGMGLYLIKTQAEALGGGVSMVSEENQGACFTVYVKSNAE